MSNAIMSRFDVIFILLDRPDADRLVGLFCLYSISLLTLMCDRDHLLSEHVIALHRGAKDDEPSQRPGSSRIGKHNCHEHARTLAQRLELTAGQVRDKTRQNETKRDSSTCMRKRLCTSRVRLAAAALLMPRCLATVHATGVGPAASNNHAQVHSVRTQILPSHP
jgi:hypothetical protein